MINRRIFLKTSALAGVGLSLLPNNLTLAAVGTSDNKPVLLGGRKPTGYGFSKWPVYDQSEEKALLDILHSNEWGRLDGSVTAKFEAEYARINDTTHCLAVSSGTSALYTMLGALDVGPGDEVILPVYTFVASYNVVVLNYALPILIDTDPETFQIDADKIEPAITKQTKLIMPVHIGGSPADMDRVLEIGRNHNLPIIEDACQAHLAEWKGKKVGSLGLGGAFSFQSTKNLNCAEGGAITSNDEAFIRKCYGFHNQGQGGTSTSYTTGEGTRGTNLRLTEFQANLLLAQMTRLEQQAGKRSENAAYLTNLFNEIPGIIPAKLYEGTTNSAYHLYMFRYDKSKFQGLSRERFIEAMSAEGVPCSTGYGQMNSSAYVQGLAENKHYLKIYGEKGMREWLDRIRCPQNDTLTKEESVWFTQTMLLGSRTDMEMIADAVRKIQKYAGDLKK
jgi:Predicted pyridoxal phosphate-dependent enzyme apparently involved in regulation of cell wall biogenesis